MGIGFDPVPIFKSFLWNKIRYWGKFALLHTIDDLGFTTIPYRIWEFGNLRAILLPIKPYIMLKKFSITDKLLFLASFLSLIFSEILYFKGEENAAIFIGIWVPSILAFGIYLNLINNKKNDWDNTLFCWTHNHIIRSWIFFGIKRNEKTKKLTQ